MSDRINFHLEDAIGFRQPGKGFVRQTIVKIADSEKRALGDINIIFCSDEYLLCLNKTHLRHDYYTDVITFDYGFAKTISGDIFISIDRINENSKLYSQDFDIELIRVIIHGVLHLCGHGDKSLQEVKIMRSKEAKYLKFHLNSAKHVPRETLPPINKKT